MRISDWSSDVCSSDLADDDDRRDREIDEGQRDGGGRKYLPPHSHLLQERAVQHDAGPGPRDPAGEEGPRHDRDGGEDRIGLAVAGDAEEGAYGDEEQKVDARIENRPGRTDEGAAVLRLEVAPDQGRSEEHTSELQ